MVYPEPDSLEFACNPLLCLQTDQTACKMCRWQVRLSVHRQDESSVSLSLGSSCSLSPPSCLCFFHAHSIVFTNHCFYSELVFVFLSLLRTEDSYGFNAVFLQNNSNKIRFSLPFVSFYSWQYVNISFLQYVQESMAYVYSTDIRYIGLFSPMQCIEIVSTSLVNGILNSQKGLILQTWQCVCVCVFQRGEGKSLFI